MRLFVAIWLNDEVRKTLKHLQDGLRPRCAEVRWTPPEQTHITVKFLGEVEDRRVPEVSAALAQAAGMCPPFGLVISGAGCFPPRGAVRIVWAGAENAQGLASKCAECVENSLETIGFARETRPFSPHITIGRVPADRSMGRLRGMVETAKVGRVAQPVSELRLMASVLSPHGSVYDTVAALPLKG